MRVVWIVPVLAAVAGCVTDSGSQTAPLSVQDAKTIILAEKDRAWKDPGSIQGAGIAPPYSCLGWTACICVEANAKNSFGGYSGLRQTVANISGRSVVNFRESGIGDQCGAMEPFPELNGGYVPQRQKSGT